MDKSRNITKFTKYSMIPLVILMALIVIFTYAYKSSSLDTYHSILLVLIVGTIGIAVFLLAAVGVILYSWHQKRIAPLFIWFLRIAMVTMMPVTIFLAGLFKRDKDSMRKIFIDINNMISGGFHTQYKPSELLIVLPHCLQNAACNIKVTGSIFNCKRCGRCDIGDILKLSEQTSIEVCVATGGTAARKAVAKKKPRMILAVACERDLMSGIMDIDGIPVIGLLNQRPEGPCFNTRIDMALIRQKIYEILDRSQ